jgi:diguanylate cyclase (GGDEF)-like protein
LSWRSRFVIPLTAIFIAVIGGLIGLFLIGLGDTLGALPEADRLAATAGLGTRLILLGLVGLAALVAGTTIIVDRRIKAPADRLLKAFRRTARGDLPEPLKLETRDEFGSLVAGFNELLGPLRQQREVAAGLHRHLEGELNAALADSATDPLTGLYNRRFFRYRLAEEVARAARYGHQLSLVLADLDRFSAVNQEHGRESGDRTLADLANLIRSSVRGCDFVARCGGEEFALIIPETDPAGAHFLARRLRQKVAEHPAWADGRTVRSLTISLGIACFPQDARTADELFERAWKSVLLAKEMGANQVRHYGEVLTSGPGSGAGGGQSKAP